MAIYKIWLKVFITFFVECVNGEILQEPNNVGSLNESDVRLDTHIPVAEVIRIIWWQYEGNFVFGLQIV